MYEHNEALSRILAQWYELEPWERRQAKQWYPSAYDWVTNASVFYGIEKERVAAILSVLSPAVAWDINKNDALQLITLGEDATVSTYGDNKVKALRLLNGADIYKEMITGQKTWNFFNNIINPKAREFVTIDRHIAKFLGLREERIPRAIYLDAQVNFYDAGRILRELPSTVQAGVWEAVRSEERCAA